MMRRIGGFTLIELMIAVAIVAVIAAIAYPSYTRFIARGDRTEAQRELVRIASLEEQYFNDHRTYTTDMDALLGNGATSYTTENGFYTVTAAAVSDIKYDFILTATAVGAQASRDTDCAELTLTNLGEKSGTSTDCWG